MMRFPALLAAKLARNRIEGLLRPAQQRRMVAFADPAEVLHPGSDHPVCHERIRDLFASLASIIWIGEGEPLSHLGIAHFVRAVARSGHYIFLETKGALLRRRIHEFQPLPRFFVTVRLDAALRARSGFAVEGLHAARLSGFFTTVHSRVDGNSDLSELEQLRELLADLGVDGWLITAGSADRAVAAKAREAQRLISSAAWRWFSEQIERELLIQVKDKELRRVVQTERPDKGDREEGVKVA